ncbi:MULTISPECIES: DNA/RNA non-specific endonuclease [Rhodomicrobium]|uniref:DNA/RNA non-specific endonuclease n=1 Tax=Rhodomicrobium TaxID=1068 RepID=UPI000B4B034F|nr:MULTISPECIES: DNA/RNA non-specific endonuclease [Rhodomicrobium]
MTAMNVLQSQLQDREVFSGLKSNNALKATAETVLKGTSNGLESVRTAPDLESALEKVVAGKADLSAPGTAEAIIMVTGYPSLMVKNGDFEEPAEPVWRSRLNPHREAIKGVIRSVGRVDLKNHPSLKWAGTCWLVDDDVLITNRHVAELFCEMRQTPQLRKDIQVCVDFAEEFGSDTELEYLIGSLIHIEPIDSIVDLALMRLAKNTAGQLKLEPVPLSTDLRSAEFIGTVGYPANDLRNNPRDPFIRIFQGKFEKKRFAPGRIMDPQHQTEVFTHNCTTLGGNSGSAVFDVRTGAALGLHFGGRPQEQNYAVKAEFILDRLRKSQIHVVDFRPRDTPRTNGAAGHAGTDPSEARPLNINFDDRDGYDPNFLGDGDLSLPMPLLNLVQAARAAETPDRDIVLKYRHFSVIMNAERRLAYCAASNIDGNSLRNPRRASKFQLDPRLPVERQAGDALYRSNDFDRGHLVRRLDPCWGEEDAARQANTDSMFYPNIAPQHKDLNQKIWNDLEEHILQTVDDRNARVSVFVGCIFGDNDPELRNSGVKVPMEFWKVIASTAPSGRRRQQQLQAQAFVMSQRSLVKPGDLEIVFGQGFETFQITVEQLERITGLDFHKLKDADTFGLTERTRERMRQESAETSRPAASLDSHFKRLRELEDIVM